MTYKTFYVQYRDFEPGYGYVFWGKWFHTLQQVKDAMAGVVNAYSLTVIFRNGPCDSQIISERVLWQAQ